jgi:hypothetical protein
LAPASRCPASRRDLYVLRARLPSVPATSPRGQHVSPALPFLEPGPLDRAPPGPAGRH